MKDSNLQESNMKEVFCRYIRKAGKIIYPKNGKYFHFYVTAQVLRLFFRGCVPGDTSFSFAHCSSSNSF